MRFLIKIVGTIWFTLFLSVWDIVCGFVYQNVFIGIMGGLILGIFLAELRDRLEKIPAILLVSFLLLTSITAQASVVDLDQRLPKVIPYGDSLFLKPGPNCLDPHWTSRERAAHLIVP
jgi:hypothetical protein